MYDVCCNLILYLIIFMRMFYRNPHATVDIFKTLKHNFEEADVDRAIQVGSDIASTSGRPRRRHKLG